MTKKRTRSGVEILAKHPGWKTKPEAKANPKPRILGVKVIRDIDTDADTSYYGEYSQRATSPYSIDRAHTAECASLETNHRATVDKLERIIDSLRENTTYFSNVIEESIDTLAGLQYEAQECDCGERGDMRQHEYRYFNPSDNYKGDTPENIRKYVAQDYARMQAYNENEWSYLGIRAEARIGIPDDTTPACCTVQTIRSGGLWGIESDSDDGYFKEVASEELDNLKRQLSALGFSKRAIATAFKTVKEVDA